MGNIVTAVFEQGGYSEGIHARTDPLWQFDYGQVLKLEGVELPDAYEVHFSNTDKGISKTVIGNADGVAIPDEYLLSGKQVYAWVYLHTGESDGETEYSVSIPVNKRSQPTDYVPTPVQHDVIDQAIAALQNAVEKCESDVEHYPKIVENYWYVWDADEGDFVNTGVDARGLKGDTGYYFTPDVSQAGVISWTNNGGLPNPEPVDLAGVIHLDDYATKAEVSEVNSTLSGEIDATNLEVARKIDLSMKGASNGVAELDENGKVLSSQLPSFVDDVVEYVSRSMFPTRGETGKIYVSTSTNQTYRWSGTSYVVIGSSLALGETSSTAYRGDRGSQAYTHAVINKGRSYNAGLYKITTNGEGHVTNATEAVASDIPGFEMVAVDYNDLSFPASAGTYCIHDGKLYVAKVQVYSHTWEENKNYFNEVTVGEAINSFSGKIDDVTTPIYRTELNGVEGRKRLYTKHGDTVRITTADGNNISYDWISFIDNENSGMMIQLPRNVKTTTVTVYINNNDIGYYVQILDAPSNTQKLIFEDIDSPFYPAPVIDDTAGTGDTTVTWSADKLYSLEQRVADLEYEPLAFSSMSVSPNLAEIGSTVSSATISYAMNKAAEHMKLDDVSIVNTSATGTISLTGLSLTSNKTWTLKAQDERQAEESEWVSRTATLTFTNKVKYGVAADGTVNDTFLNGLSNRVLSTGKVRSFTANAGANEYIWYALPSSYGACTFTVGGFSGGFSLVETFNHTNESGATVEYRVYRSDNANLGNTSITVS